MNYWSRNSLNWSYFWLGLWPTCCFICTISS